jgi:hypothetical protein
MAQSALEYYNSENNYGKYAYISLFDIINEILGDTIDPDNYLTNTRRSQIVAKAKNGIRLLNREVKKTILAVEITIGPDLYIPVPQDYIDWVRLSVVGPDFKLYPLRANYDIPTALGYLQDSEYELLFDVNGEILTADSSNHFNKTYRKYIFEGCETNAGEFVIDERRGVIGFSSDLKDREIVIEYISDGIQMNDLKEEEITIHKNIKDALVKFVYMECISGRRNVPANEKRRAKDEFNGYLHKAKMDNLHFNIAELNSKIQVDGHSQAENKNGTVINNTFSGGWYSRGF